MAAVSLTLGSNEYPLTVVDGTALTLSLSGPAGATGATGATGAAGPNTVSTSTSTNLTGYIYGNGTTVGGATAATSAATANTLVLRNASGGVAVSTINNLAITAAANSILTIDEDKGITLFDSITTEFGGYINTDAGGYIVTGVNGNITTGAGGHIQTGIGGHISTTAGGSFSTGTGNLTGPDASGTVALINPSTGTQTFSGAQIFDSTTRPTSSGTGTPTATSLITLADVEGRFGPRGKYDLDPQTVVLQQTLNTATAPVLGGRFSSTYSFNFGSPAGNPAGVVFVPFYITKIRTYTKCAIAITAGTSVADVLYGGIYLPDASGFPKTRLGDVWQWSCASVSNLVEATINVGEVSGLFYVALLPSKGAADWVTNNGTNLVVRATDQAGANAGFREVFNACPRDLSANVGAFGILATGGISSLPADMSSPEVRRPSSYSAVTHPVCILY